jgi:hypothetical protein
MLNNNKIKVAWICHFSNKKINQMLPLKAGGLFAFFYRLYYITLSNIFQFLYRKFTPKFAFCPRWKTKDIILLRPLDKGFLKCYNSLIGLCLNFLRFIMTPTEIIAQAISIVAMLFNIISY